MMIVRGSVFRRITSRVTLLRSCLIDIYVDQWTGDLRSSKFRGGALIGCSRALSYAPRGFFSVVPPTRGSKSWLSEVVRRVDMCSRFGENLMEVSLKSRELLVVVVLRMPEKQFPGPFWH